MAQIIRITSEALQATVRRLLPSQQGFGEDLQASNVIQPIIDLTPTAEGSVVRSDLQTALALDSQTAFTVQNATTTLANSPGFWRIFGTSNVKQAGASNVINRFQLTDGFSTKTVWGQFSTVGSSTVITSLQVDFTVFLGPGESLQGVSNNTNAVIEGSYRQIADSSGNLINPSGFNPE